jgi:hypothetical protein
MARYLDEFAPTRVSAAWIADMAEDVLAWWSDKTLADVNGRNCRAYAEWRVAQPIRSFKRSKPRNVGRSTARHELSVLQAAIRYFNREYGPLTALPVVTLPPKTPPKTGYFWTRQEAARRVRAARRRPETHHLVRLILIGLYSGTRLGAMLRLRWVPSVRDGWIDVEAGIMHRRGTGAAETKKRRPPARIHHRLLQHLQRWQRQDAAHGISYVIHFEGRPVKRVKRSWATVRRMAGSDRPDGTHILRHTAATWFMSDGLAVAEIAGFLGMSVQTLEDVYGHHHPDFQENVARSSPGKRPGIGMNRTRTR